MPWFASEIVDSMMNQGINDNHHKPCNMSIDKLPNVFGISEYVTAKKIERNNKPQFGDSPLDGNQRKFTGNGSDNHPNKIKINGNWERMNKDFTVELMIE